MSKSSDQLDDSNPTAARNLSCVSADDNGKRFSVTKPANSSAAVRLAMNIPNPEENAQRLGDGRDC